MRNLEFENGEYYHVFNRGIDGRNIFSEHYDLDRFLTSLVLFNNTQPIGSIYEKSFENHDGSARKRKLVEIICYCLNPNHIHLLLRQITSHGISIFMHRLGGYTMYFNEKYKRKGSLFQGPFRAKYIEDNNYLLHTSAYINLNARVHRLGGEASKLSESSWPEYTKEKVLAKICKTGIILSQFKNKKEYAKFCEESLELMLQSKDEAYELKSVVLED